MDLRFHQFSPEMRPFFFNFVESLFELRNLWHDFLFLVVEMFGFGQLVFVLAAQLLAEYVWPMLLSFSMLSIFEFFDY